jgi:hypothetical protein
MRSGDDFSRLEAYVRESLLVRTADRITKGLVVGLGDASVGRALHGAWVRAAARPPAERVRAAALFAAAASVGHLLLLPLVPPHIAPALPKSLWVLVAAAAGFAAAFAERLAACWPTSRLRALARWLWRLEP